MHCMDVEMGTDAHHTPAVLHWANNPQNCNVLYSLKSSLCCLHYRLNYPQAVEDKMSHLSKWHGFYLAQEEMCIYTENNLMKR